MRFLVMSDTHGEVNHAFSAHSLSGTVDAVIHLGDGCADAALLRVALEVKVINVSGNCDIGSGVPRELVLECEGKRILLTHGDAYQVKSGFSRLRRRAAETGADVILFGHTHEEMFEDGSGLLLMNPGTLSKVGRHRSFAIMDVTPEGITVRHHHVD